MTNPQHAVATDDGRYYIHPETGQHLISVTNVLGECLSKPALVPWAAKAANDKAWEVLPRMVAAMLRPADCRPAGVAERREWEPCGKCRPCVEREIKGHHTVIKDSAAELGSLVHDAAEARVLGAPQVANPDVEPFIDQFLRFLDDFGLDIEADFEATELTVANPRLGYAGTLDAIVRLPFDAYLAGDERVRRLPDGQRKLWLIDYKSSLTQPASTLYDSHPLQLAGLRFATEMWLPDGSVVPMLKGVSGCAILNLRTDDYALIPLHVGQSEKKAFGALITGALWRHSKPLRGASAVGPDGLPETKRARTRRAANPGKAA